jgi:hypothetical protein
MGVRACIHCNYAGFAFPRYPCIVEIRRGKDSSVKMASALMSFGQKYKIKQQLNLQMPGNSHHVVDKLTSISTKTITEMHWQLRLN